MTKSSEKVEDLAEKEHIITSIAWIPRGASRSRPIRFEYSQEEVARIKRLAK